MAEKKKAKKERKRNEKEQEFKAQVEAVQSSIKKKKKSKKVYIYKKIYIHIICLVWYLVDLFFSLDSTVGIHKYSFTSARSNVFYFRTLISDTSI